MLQLTPAKKGIVTALTMMTSSICTFYLFHLPDNGNSQYLILSEFIGGMLWVLLSFGKENPGSSFKAYFNTGFKAFVMITFLMVVYAYVFYKLNPQIMEEGIRMNDELIRKEGNKTAAEIAANDIQLRNIYMPMMLSLTTIKYLFLGALSTAITGGLLSQKK